MTKLPFDCDYCDVPVEMTTGPGRMVDHRTGLREAPADLPLAICPECGGVYLRTADAEALDAAFSAGDCLG